MPAAWVDVTHVNVTRTPSKVWTTTSPSTACSDTGHCTVPLKDAEKKGNLNTSFHVAQTLIRLINERATWDCGTHTQSVGWKPGVKLKGWMKRNQAKDGPAWSSMTSALEQWQQSNYHYSDIPKISMCHSTNRMTVRSGIHTEAFSWGGGQTHQTTVWSAVTLRATGGGGRQGSWDKGTEGPGRTTNKAPLRGKMKWRSR